MSDNVLKFRPIEKKPDPQPPKKPGLPGWWPWAALIGVAVIMYLVRQPGIV